MKPLLFVFASLFSIFAFAESEPLNVQPNDYGRGCEVELRTRNGGFLQSFYGRDCNEALWQCEEELDYRRRTGRNPYARCEIVRPYPPPPPPPPPRETWTCIAMDRGQEEHYGGHPGYGRSQREAADNAMHVCLASHGRCFISECYPDRRR
ncbi:MAG: hypothetical protein IPK04_12540 [Bdellovibrionales bacterium]|nr:hypothetical protein [Bdellovibrionales bacterium]